MRESFDQIHNLAAEKIEEHREEKDIQISGNMVLFTSIIVLYFSAFSIYFLFFPLFLFPVTVSLFTNHMDKSDPL